MPVRCPKCGAGMVRLQRKKGCDITKDYWVHVKSEGDTAPCLSKITFYPAIKIDTRFSLSKTA